MFKTDKHPVGLRIGWWESLGPKELKNWRLSFMKPEPRCSVLQRAELAQTMTQPPLCLHLTEGRNSVPSMKHTGWNWAIYIRCLCLSGFRWIHLHPCSVGHLHVSQELPSIAGEIKWLWLAVLYFVLLESPSLFNFLGVLRCKRLRKPSFNMFSISLDMILLIIIDILNYS